MKYLRGGTPLYPPRIAHPAELIQPLHGKGLLQTWLALDLGRGHQHTRQTGWFNVLLSFVRREDHHVLREFYSRCV